MISGRPGACFKLPVCSSACADLSSSNVVPGTCSILGACKIPNPIFVIDYVLATEAVLEIEINRAATLLMYPQTPVFSPAGERKKFSRRQKFLRCPLKAGPFRAAITKARKVVFS